MRNEIAVLFLAAWVGGAAVAAAAWSGALGGSSVASGIVGIAAGAVGAALLGARAVARHDAGATAAVEAANARVSTLEGRLGRIEAALEAEVAGRAADAIEGGLRLEEASLTLAAARRVAEAERLDAVAGWEATLAGATRARDRAVLALAFSSEGAIGIGDDGRVEWINAEAVRILEVTDADPPPVGRTVAQVARDTDVALVMADAWLSRGTTCREVALVPLALPDPPSRQGASARLVRVTAVPFVGDPSMDDVAACDGLPGVIFLVDETERRRAETIRRDFVANVTHELRTPLTSLKALAETLEEGAIDDPEASREFLRLMHDEVDSLTQLVLGALDLTLIESGQVPVNKVPVLPALLLGAAQRRMRTQANRQGVELRIAMEDALPPIHADPLRIGEVLLNLVQNGIKFTPRDGAVSISASRDPAGVRFAVADTGVGVAPDEVSRLFERFYKTDRSRASAGTGLGLAIAKHLVQAHDGTIGAESAGLGRGTTIWFTVPLAPPVGPTDGGTQGDVEGAGQRSEEQSLAGDDHGEGPDRPDEVTGVAVTGKARRARAR